MTYLFDDPTSFPADAVEGLVAAHPEELLRVHGGVVRKQATPAGQRSEEHTSELQSRGHLVCRLLLEKKKPSSARMSDTTTRKVGNSSAIAHASCKSHDQN